MTDAIGSHPISPGPLPNPIGKLLNTQMGVQQLPILGTPCRHLVYYS